MGNAVTAAMLKKLQDRLDNAENLLTDYRNAVSLILVTATEALMEGAERQAECLEEIKHYASIAYKK
jgi:hypothetical protein